MTDSKENLENKTLAVKNTRKRKEVKRKVENKNTKTNEMNKTKKAEPKKRDKIAKENERNTNKKQDEKRVVEQNGQIVRKESDSQNKNRGSKGKRRNSKRMQEEVRIKKSPLKIIPLGGLLEIGKNITVFEYEDEIIIVDCGLAFPTEDMLGVDLVVADTTYPLWC